MILIADSGSTKTEWRLIGEPKLTDNTCITKGINPFHQTTEEILTSLKEGFTLKMDEIDEIHFYGAGCATPEKINIVKRALYIFFGTDNISVDSDLAGAARSLCGNKAGIACILGTGSNSCLYDGKNVAHHVSPLGYLIGDEGSGAFLGKQLLGDILKNLLPQYIIDLFWQEYPTDRAEILDNIYKKPLVSRYLAQYTKFLSKYINLPELDQLVTEAFSIFIKRNLLQYNNVLHLEINFTGSVAYYFQPQLKKALNQHNLTLGVIAQAPMNGLEQYHLLTTMHHGRNN